MKNMTILTLSALLIMSCTGKTQSNDEADKQPVTDVSTVNITYGHIDREIELTAVTAFLKKSIETAPVSSFITACYVQPGTTVRRGQILYRLESKEREALGGDVVGKNMGIVSVKASADGVVDIVQQQAGGYVTEGTPLCSIANTGSMVFEIDVPTEDMRYATPGTVCRISLPDGCNFAATLSTPLASMDINSQVQQIPAHARVPFLPEGLRAKAILKAQTHSGGNSQILPKSAIQSDDNMTTFWVMIVTAHGTAQKIPVTIGNSNNTESEIVSPKLSPADKIITEGSYQLQDGDKVRIVK